MIQEIINYTKHLKENSPQVFEQGLEPNKGLHIFLELDDEGKAINFPGEKGVNWDYYDGKEMSPFLNEIMKYEQEGLRIGTRMDKVLDTAIIKNSKKFQVFTCSPFILGFKKQSYDLIDSRLDSFFNNAINVCLDEDNEEIKKKIYSFKNTIREKLTKIDLFRSNQLQNDDEMLSNYSIFGEMKKDFFVTFYLKNISLSDYQKAHQLYLRKNLFNKRDYNSDKEIIETTYGLSGFYNGLNQKKTFLEHKTASMFKGIPGRIQAKDSVFLNDFDLLLKRKVFPQPLPIFIDKNEFSTSEEILKIFKENGALTYTQILKRIFKTNNDIVLQNYYLLYFNYKYELHDFDFVSKFRYSLKENDTYPKIKNIFELKKNKELIPSREIKNIFHFEAEIVKKIFNHFLVGSSSEGQFYVNYFGEIKPDKKLFGEKISEPVFQIILKYRKAFYDYIYKSKTQAINSFMWDEIMWNSIIGDLRSDKITDKGYHSKEYSIKEKLNIWFSLYNYFSKNKERKDMASKIPELLEKMKEVANNDNEHFKTTEEFAFGAGQVIREILNKSEAHERTHALLEPFLQKTKGNQLNLAIARAFETYKHGFKFYKGNTRYAFDKIMSETMGFEMNENLKKELPMILAGYFAKSVFEKDDENNDNKESKNE